MSTDLDENACIIENGSIFKSKVIISHYSMLIYSGIIYSNLILFSLLYAYLLLFHWKDSVWI